jgi:hypothetical protein
VLPRFEIVARRRPVDLIQPGLRRVSASPAPSLVAFGAVAPYSAVVLDLDHAEIAGRLTLTLEGYAVPLRATYDGGRRLIGLEVGDRTVRSRRHARPGGPVRSLGLTLTGTHLTALSHDGVRWTAHGRVDLSDVVDTRDPARLAALAASWQWQPRGAEPAPVTAVHAGPFGQLGLRDLHVATTAEGETVRLGDRIVLTATHAGPGAFDTGHCGVWALDPGTLELEHLADLYFTRDDRPGVFGDHATHLVRDGDTWLVLTSTWGDFDRTRVDITMATTTGDLLTGEHVLASTRVAVPSDGVGVWDPHLTRIDGEWHLAYTWARKFFRFAPGLARGPLDALEPVAEDRGRRATEGTVLVELDGQWRLLASDGRENPERLRKRYPIFDLALQEIGTVPAPYLTNLPWPMLVRDGDDWLMLAFNGTRAGGELLDYGTHGEVVILRGRPVQPDESRPETA